MLIPNNTLYRRWLGTWLMERWQYWVESFESFYPKNQSPESETFPLNMFYKKSLIMICGIKVFFLHPLIWLRIQTKFDWWVVGFGRSFPELKIFYFIFWLQIWGYSYMWNVISLNKILIGFEGGFLRLLFLGFYFVKRWKGWLGSFF